MCVQAGEFSAKWLCVDGSTARAKIRVEVAGYADVTRYISAPEQDGITKARQAGRGHTLFSILVGEAFLLTGPLSVPAARVLQLRQCLCGECVRLLVVVFQVDDNLSVLLLCLLMSSAVSLGQ